ncbi:hypothetical protein [Rubinisphaera margarita]|uniref:hypothetical protein n=1 Tax=Rubinisphaera margarita TaxID=2909586 RepID=UPI001EE7B1B6|nr:hypothetical protein [Rubinisphaera margarita]MCG6155355.1 hypothetical protein [Rubinisphaera margarita]
MGIEVHYRTLSGEEVVYSLSGNSEYEDVWLPIVVKEELGFIDVIASGGLPVSPDDCEQICREFVEIRKALFETGKETQRVDRCIATLRDYGGGNTRDVYIG